MSHWRYVMSRERDTTLAEGDEDVYAIREFYEFDNGKTSWTADAVEAQGDSPHALARDLARMLLAVNSGEMLDLTLDEPAIVQRPVPCGDCAGGRCHDARCCPPGPCPACTPQDAA
jgi:hypothetical protein